MRICQCLHCVHMMPPIDLDGGMIMNVKGKMRKVFYDNAEVITALNRL